MTERLSLRILATVLLALVLASPLATASSVTVPDDAVTVQDAIATFADTVLIRPGTYLERPVVDRSLVIRGIDGQRPRLNGLDVENTNFLAPRILDVGQCAFSGPIRLRTVTLHPRNLTIWFSDCTLDSGIVQVSNLDTQDIEYLIIHRSRIGASSPQINLYGVAMAADTLDGGVAFYARDVNIRGCWFRGGTGRAIALSNETSGRISNNIIESYPTGVYGNMEFMVIDSNTVARCGLGMHLAAGECTVRGNTITNSGGGIYAGGGRHMIDGNIITNSGAYGIYLDAPDRPIVRSNVIGESGGSGVVLELAFRPTVVSNTLYHNGDAGIDVLNHDAGTIAIARNIGFENQTWGLKSSPELPLQLSCNDWFANVLGATSGIAPGTTDVSIDPSFCAVDSGDVSLTADSPLLEIAGCDSIGARGVGCAITATLLSMIEVDEERRANVLRWRFGSDEPQACWVERSSNGTHDWNRLPGAPTATFGGYAYRDADIDLTRAYWYRVGWLEGTEALLSSPIESGIRDQRTEFSVSPNPGKGPASIAWTQRTPGQVSIRVYDLSGREVAVVINQWFVAGRHEVRWDGRPAYGGVASPGWYAVRLMSKDFQSEQAYLLLR